MEPNEENEAIQSNKVGMLMGFAHRIKENAAQAFKDAKPWTEVFDRHSISKPTDATDLTNRLRKNANYFRTNYLIAAVGTTSLVLFLNPWSIIVLAGLAMIWFYAYILRTGPLVIGGRELSEREKFLALAGSSLVTIFFLTSVGSILFYALGLSMLLIGAHAALRQPDDATLFLDEVPENRPTGFLSMLTGGGSRAVAVASGV